MEITRIKEKKSLHTFKDSTSKEQGKLLRTKLVMEKGVQKERSSDLHR